MRKRGRPGLGGRRVPARHPPAIGEAAEGRFLLACVRAACGLDGPSPAGDELDVIDWERLERIAVAHRLVPLLHHGIELGGIAAPPLHRERIARRARRIALYNLRRSVEAAGVTKAFEGAGIPPVWFKGPVLAQVLHGSPSLRQFVDLDVLVPVGALPVACELLEARGYLLEAPRGVADVDMRRRQRAAVAQHFAIRQFEFQHERHRGRLDLHWRFTPSWAAWDAVESVLRRAATVPLGTGSVRTLGKEDQLLHLCLHGSMHLWYRLGWLVDLACHVQLFGTATDWDEVWERAVRARCRRRLLWGLYLADRIFGAPLPEVMGRRVRDAEARLRRASHVVRLEEQVNLPTMLTTFARPMRWEMEPRARLRYWAVLLSAPRLSVLRIVLPSGWLAAYRVVWPLWGLWRVLRRLGLWTHVAVRRRR